MAGDDEQGTQKPSEQRGGTTPDKAEAREKGEWAETASDGIVPADLGGSDAPREMLGDDPELGSAVLGRTTGKWLPDLFRDLVAGPLQFRHWAMPMTPTGDAFMGGGMRLLPRDFMKMGQMMIDGGRCPRNWRYLTRRREPAAGDREPAFRDHGARRGTEGGESWVTASL